METINKYIRNSGDCKALALDNQVASTLNTVAADASTRECTSAQGLLKLIFGGTFSEWIEPLNNNQNQRRANFLPTQEKSTYSKLKLYPNPASDMAMVAYYLPENTTKAIFEIYDMMGKKISSFLLATESNQTEISVAGLKTGIYYCSLSVDGFMIDKIKFVVLK